MNFGTLPLGETLVIYILMIWALIWKGLALWRASHANQKNWFVVLLVLNTIGILELVYLFRFAKKKLTIAEIKDWFRKTFTTKKAE